MSDWTRINGIIKTQTSEEIFEVKNNKMFYPKYKNHWIKVFGDKYSIDIDDNGVINFLKNEEEITEEEFNKHYDLIKNNEHILLPGIDYIVYPQEVYKYEDGSIMWGGQDTHNIIISGEICNDDILNFNFIEKWIYNIFYNFNKNNNLIRVTHFHIFVEDPNNTKKNYLIYKPQLTYNLLTIAL